MFPRRGQLAQVGRNGAYGVDVRKAEGHARLVGHGGQMQRGIGGAAQRHIHRKRVAHGLGVEDVQRAQVLPVQFHHLRARFLGQADARRVGRGDGSVARQRQAQRLGKAVHGVGGKHAGAGTAGGARVVFRAGQRAFVDVSGHVRAHCLKGAV